MSEFNPGSSASERQVISEMDMEKCDVVEPEAKKIKLSINIGKSEKLEQRLGGILCCAVCLDLPNAAVYQCTNGHLMCAGCITHLLADARLRDESATCPTCRVEFSRQSASRNLAVEKAVSELPMECQFCHKEYPRNSLERHEKFVCEKRITNCKFSQIGCPWRGPNHEYAEHEKVCTHPSKTGAEVMEALQSLEQKSEEEKKLYDGIFELLSFEKIAINDLQMKPYRTDEFVHKLFYETNRFSAFNYQWVVKSRINNFQSDPSHSSERDMTYQLIMKNKPTFQLTIHYLIVKGPFGDMKVKPKIYKYDFSEEECESPYTHLPLQDTCECNRLLAAKAINFRIVEDVDQDVNLLLRYGFVAPEELEELKVLLTPFPLFKFWSLKMMSCSLEHMWPISVQKQVVRLLAIVIPITVISTANSFKILNTKPTDISYIPNPRMSGLMTALK